MPIPLEEGEAPAGLSVDGAAADADPDEAAAACENAAAAADPRGFIECSRESQVMQSERSRITATQKKVEIPRSRCGWSCVAVESMDGWTDGGSENGEDDEYAVRDVKNQQVMSERSAVYRRGRKQNKAGVSFRARRKRHAGGIDWGGEWRSVLGGSRTSWRSLPRAFVVDGDCLLPVLAVFEASLLAVPKGRRYSPNT